MPTPSSSELVKFYPSLGEALKAEGKLEEALAIYTKVLEQQPSRSLAEIFFYLGNALANQGKIDAAIASYRKIFYVAPNWAKAYHNLGVLLRKRGDLEPAVRSYQIAIGLEPNAAKSYFSLGNALVALGKIDEAIASYEKAIALETNFAPAYVELAQVLAPASRQSKLLSLEKVRRGIELLEKAIAIDPKAEVLARLSYLCNIAGEYSRGERYARWAIQLNPEYGAVNSFNSRTLAESLMGQKKFEADPTCAIDFSVLKNSLFSEGTRYSLQPVRGNLSRVRSKLVDKNGIPLAGSPQTPLKNAIGFLAPPFAKGGFGGDPGSTTFDHTHLSRSKWSNWRSEEARSDRSRPVIFLSADGRYFRDFAIAQALSLYETTPNCGIHFHIMNPEPQSLELLNLLQAKLPDLDISHSLEFVDFSASDPLKTTQEKVYYCCARFCRAAEFVSQLDTTAIVTDADILFRRNFLPAIEAKENYDIAVMDYGSGLPLYDRYCASFVVISPTQKARHYLNAVSDFIIYNLRQNPVWMLDQFALYSVADLFFNSKSGFRLGLLPPNFISIDWQDSAPIWSDATDRKNQDNPYTQLKRKLISKWGIGNWE
ncbi:MAG: tetratricopeptide repeat protein [Oscillatoria sp. SIO1A7]|nr:tetratricopeptide repeat protein [Oscillatoria sp. SIO1A7]